jgi:hypothetical protein
MLEGAAPTEVCLAFPARNRSARGFGSGDSCPPIPPTLGPSKVGEVAQGEPTALCWSNFKALGTRPEMFEEQMWLGIVDGPLSSAVANRWTKLEVE